MSLYEPIAIIGIGCRFPGNAEGPKAFWDLLCKGFDAVTSVPPAKWCSAEYHSSDNRTPGRMSVRHGAFLRDGDAFDARFFDISPREAARIDPQQRWLLEVAYEAVEDAGLSLARLAGSDTSVFVGISSNDYADIQRRDRFSIDMHTNSGNASSIAANRISYAFDLRGPSVALDTACSSALVALHLACESLHSGQCSLAIAGGVNAILTPEATIGFSKASMLSPDGRCHAFDARANGYVRGEGAGALLLKPLEQALADGDRVYAVIRATVVNQDGRTNGITVPSSEAQLRMLRRAYQLAGLSPGELHYLEAHGTGTSVGDPIETNALGEFFSPGRSPDRPCLLGSVKTNIGHLESGAGVAGVAKAALILHHRKVPPNLHFQTPNPRICWDRWALHVPVSTTALPEGQETLWAGVNSFGFGGTNAHVVLSSCPVSVAAGPGRSGRAERGTGALRVFPLSAKTPVSLAASARALADALEQAPNIPLDDWVYTACCRRSHHPLRAALLCRDRDELRRLLASFPEEAEQPAIVRGKQAGAAPPRLAFVFCGQGTQWWRMGRELQQCEPVFRAALHECHAALEPFLEWSLLDELNAEEAASRMNETQVVQPAIFALQVALVRLWESWGICPEAVVGHSVGEIAAAHVAGILSLSEAARVIYHRSRLQQQCCGGRMAAVGLTRAEGDALVRQYEEKLSVAGVNSASLLTISGDEDVVAEVVQRLEGQGIFCRTLRVDCAFHSHHMDAIKEDLLEALANLVPRPGSLPYYSTVSGALLAGETLSADYWWQNVRRPVLFAPAVDALVTDGFRHFLEIGPHPAMAGSIREALAEGTTDEGAVLASLRRKEDEQETVLRSLAELYVCGVTPKWDLLTDRRARFVQLPPYPWQHEHFWHESVESRRARLLRSVHPLLGTTDSGPVQAWQRQISSLQPAYLADHGLHNSTVFPAAAFVEMGLTVAREVHGNSSVLLEQIEFRGALFLDDQQTRDVRTVFRSEERSFAVCSWSRAEEEPWQENARGLIRETALTPPPPLDLKAAKSMFEADIGKQVLYERFAAAGHRFGPSFQGVTRIWCAPGHALGEICLPEHLEPELAEHVFHPALLDACFQCLSGATTSKLESDVVPEEGTYLPIRIDSVKIFTRPPAKLMSLVRTVSEDDETVTADLDIYTAEGVPVAAVRGFTCRRLQNTGTEGGGNETCFCRFECEPQELPADGGDDRLAIDSGGTWLVFADGGDGLGAAVADALRREGVHVLCAVPGAEFAADRDGTLAICPTEPDDFEKLMAEADAKDAPLAGIVHAWNLLAPQTDLLSVSALSDAQDIGCVSVLRLVQALNRRPWERSPRLWVITRGAQHCGEEQAPVQVAQAPVWGLVRVVMTEHTDYKPTLIDMDPEAPLDPEQVARLLNEVRCGSAESEVLFRNAQRYVHRLDRVAPEALERSNSVKVGRTGAAIPCRLDATRPGVLESLALRETGRHFPADQEVEIRVEAVGLNFRDVMKALDIYPIEDPQDRFLGDECAGTITRVGEGVERFREGDSVYGIAPGAFSAYVTVPADLIHHRPEHLSAVAAASLPVVFLTAYHALVERAGLRAGERVLIHAGAGGVGQAAIQIALALGAEVYATAGTDEKRAFLTSLGVHQVMSSRTLEFAEQIMDATAGEGVDVVLNSLAGDFIPKSLSVLKPFGRFLEIGKRDIYQDAKLGMLPFKRSLSFHSIDLARLVKERPEQIAPTFSEMAERFASGAYTPIRQQVFPIAEVASAFRFMAQARHIGKIVITMDGQRADMHPALADEFRFEQDGTYLVVGGFGGFGAAIADWLAGKGAGKVVLMGRSGGAADSARELLNRLRDKGADVEAVKADVTNEADVSRVLRQIRDQMPPLRGIIHAAMVLENGFLFQLDRERMHTVLAPKMLGAWNLHAQSLDDDLDFFVLVSSLSSFLGPPGQGNYVAANVFLDALAHHRRFLGLPALSFNLGALADVGYLARHRTVADYLSSFGGVAGIKPEKAMASLLTVMLRDWAQMGYVTINWQKLGQTPAIAVSPKFARVIGDRTGESVDDGRGSVRRRLESTPENQREEFLRDYLREQVARVLGARAKEIDPDTPLTRMGLDSLMGFELKNRIDADLAVVVPTGVFVRGLSIRTFPQTIRELLVAPPGGGQTGNGSDSAEIASVEPYGLSHEQAATWYQQGRQPDSRAWTLGFVARCRPKLDMHAFRTAVETLVTHHPTLRAVFLERTDGVQQVVRTGPNACFEVCGAGEMSADAVDRQIAQILERTYDLSAGPLFAVTAIDATSDFDVLILGTHRIVLDEWALAPVVEDLLRAYTLTLARQPVKLLTSELSYADYIRDQQQALTGPDEQQRRAFWSESLSGCRTHVGFDRARTTNDRECGHSPMLHTFEVTAETTLGLGQLAADCETDLYACMLAAFLMLLHTRSGCTDLAVLAEVDGRPPDSRYRGITGPFAHNLPIRSRWHSEQPFGDFLRQTAETFEQAFANRFYAVDPVARSSSPQSLWPDCNVRFVMPRTQHTLRSGPVSAFVLGEPGSAIDADHMILESMQTPRGEMCGDMALLVEQVPDGLWVACQCRAAVCKQGQWEALAADFAELLRTIVSDPGAKSDTSVRSLLEPRAKQQQ